MALQTLGKMDTHNTFYKDVVFDAANVVAGTAADQAVTVPGVLAGIDEVLRVIPPVAGVYGVAVVNAHVSADDTVTVRFQNNTGGDLNPASGTYRFLIARFGAA